ncbi:MAG: YIP1 family protein [Candidatus Aenigmatarchaeota archaeon]
MMNWLREWFEKSKKVIFHPKEFYREVERKEGYKYLVKFAVTSAIIASLLSALVGSSSGILFSGAPPTALPISLLIAVVVGAVGGLIGLFVGAAIIHLFVYLLGGRNYHDTLEAITYPTAVGAFFGWIPYASFLAWIYALYLQIKGVEKFHDFTTGRAAAAVLIPVVIVVGLVLTIVIGGLLYYYGSFTPSALPNTALP